MSSCQAGPEVSQRARERAGLPGFFGAFLKAGGGGSPGSPRAFSLLRLPTMAGFRFLSLVRPFMSVLPEVVQPDRRIPFRWVPLQSLSPLSFPLLPPNAATRRR